MEYTQRSLFDPSNFLRMRILQHLRGFDINEAVSDFIELGRSFFPPARFEEKRTALDSIRLRIAGMNRNNPEQLAGYLRELERSSIPSLLDSEWASLWSGFYTELGKLLPADCCGYVIADMPASEIRLECGDYQNALDTAFRCMARNGEDTLLRQIQSFAVAKIGDSRAARRYLGMALFNDPGRCRERFLPDEETRGMWREVRSRNEEEAAWIELPIHLWRKGIIPIQDIGDEFERWLAGKAGTDEGPAGIRFLRLLLLAEKSRFRDDPEGLLEEYRKKMWEIQPDRFSEYMAVLSRWEKE